ALHLLPRLQLEDVLDGGSGSGRRGRHLSGRERGAERDRAEHQEDAAGAEVHVDLLVAKRGADGDLLSLDREPAYSGIASGGPVSGKTPLPAHEGHGGGSMGPETHVGQESGSRLFRSRKEPVIVGLVALHFALGVAAGIPARSRLWTVPVLGSVAAWYAAHNLAQQWSMFSPPPGRRQSIHYALRFADGWTDLIALDPYTSEVTGRLVQPPGVFRLIVHLRATNSDSLPGGLSEKSARAHYYQELADYFCRGA